MKRSPPCCNSTVASLLLSLLLSTSGQAADAELSTLSAIGSDGKASTAAFAAGMSLDNGGSYRSAATSGDTAVITGRITPATTDVGKKADLYALVNVEGAFYMRTAAGGYQPWAGGIATLVPVQKDVTLASTQSVEVFRGKLALSGVVQVYLGYKPAGSTAVIYTLNPLRLEVQASTSPALNPGVLTTTQAKSTFPSATKAITPAWQIVSVNGSYFNSDIVLGFENGSVSDDGNKVVFSSWSAHGFGLGTRSCSFDWIYVRDIAKQTLSVAAYDLAGKILCGYESAPQISGNGNYVVYSGSQKPYSHSTLSMQGFYRSAIGSSGYDPVNAKGLEFSFEQNGSLKLGTILKGEAHRFAVDTDGNSIAFSMKYLENVTEVPRQYNATLFARAMLRTDKGALTVGNQDYTLNHGTAVGSGPSLYFDVSDNGTVVIYNEVIGGKARFRGWDMLARQDLGMLFNDQVTKEPDVSPGVCGISADGRYVLVDHTYSVPLDPARATTSYAKLTSGQLSRYDRLKKEFLYVAVSEEESRSIDAGCDWFTNGDDSRQLSKDANRVFWDSGGYFFIRDIAAGKTIKIKQASTIYQWVPSGDGRYIVFSSDKSPDGTQYKNSYGSNMPEIYRYGPIEAADFGSSFSLRSFEDKLVAK